MYVSIKRVGASVFQNRIVDCKMGIECLFQFRGARHDYIAWFMGVTLLDGESWRGWIEQQKFVED